MNRREFIAAGVAAGAVYGQTEGRSHRLPENDSHYRRVRDYVEEAPVPEYRWASEQAYEAFRDMITHANLLGANAVIGIRYDATEIMPGITEVLCYGTAIQVEAHA